MFRSYDQNQSMLLPLNLKDMLPEDHIARVISDVLDQVDISGITYAYSKEGSPAYHPLMLLKVLLYAYIQGIRSSRKIFEKLHTDIAFMFLAAMQKPDFRTICRFRSEHLEKLSEIFVHVLGICKELGMIDLGTVSLDGTKFKANASLKQTKDKKGIEKEMIRLEGEIKKILKEAEEIDEQEDVLYGDSTPYQAPKEIATRKDRMKKLEEVKKKLEKSGEKINITDNDAKLMQWRDKTKKPGYNSQLVVDEKEKVILAADLVDEVTDHHQLRPMLEQVEENLGKPEKVIADPGYSSYENLEYLEEKGIEGYIPDNFFDVEEEGTTKRYRKSKFKYNTETDSYTCPEGSELRFKVVQKRKDKPDLRIYTGTECHRCKNKEKCTKAKHRIITRDPREHLIKDMRDKLRSEEGKKTYLKRLYTIEPVFGNFKFNKGFTHFLLRGLKKVRIEFILMCIAHNIEKIWRFTRGKSVNLKIQPLIPS